MISFNLGTFDFVVLNKTAHSFSLEMLPCQTNVDATCHAFAQAAAFLVKAILITLFADW